mgnify:CR=1 FL=1|tara:strand:+ start:1521 stop:2126 length:606 start_codon:yes stop_codon:yes gene_type:complete
MDIFLSNFKNKNVRAERVGDFFKHSLTPELLRANPSKIYLEIGCGHGHWLCSFAQETDDVLFVGIDLITKRIEKANSKKIKRELNNIFFLKADAMEFLSFMPDSVKFSSCFLMYPDPWPKKRHHKRRIIQPEFLNLLADKSNEDCKLYFKTDHTEYFDWTLQTIKNSQHWNIQNYNWPFESDSYFQQLLPNHQFCSASKLD